MIIRTGKENQVLYQDFQYVKKLNFRDDSQSQVFYDNHQNVIFLGSVMPNKIIQWQNLYTNNITNQEVYVDRLYINNSGAKQYCGEFLATQRCNEGEIIFVDLNLEQLRKVQKDYADFMFHITQKAEIDGLRKMNNNGIIDFAEMQQWEAFSRIRVHCFRGDNTSSLYIDQFKKGLEIAYRKFILLSDNKLRFAYFPDEQKILFKDKMISVECEAVRELMITCKANQMINKAIQMDKSTISILNSKGYIYLEPFSVSEELSGSKIVITASRQMELEIYDNDQNIWRKLEQKKLSNVKKNQQIQLRMRVKFGDRIHEVAIVK